MISVWRGHGMAQWGFCWVFLGLWRFSVGCPAYCTCSSSRISCIDQERGILDFPVLQNDIEMENVTEIYIANQSKLESINDMDLKMYRNLRNLTVTNTSLTNISRQAFLSNARLQYLNLKDNKLSTLSWKVFRHLNLSYLILSGNRLRCSCENMWIRLWLGDEADSQELRCVEDSGRERLLSQLSLPGCVPPVATLTPSNITVIQGADVVLECSASGAPPLERTWNFSTLVSGKKEKNFGQRSEVRLSNLSSVDNGCKITCNVENDVGENESSVVLDILFAPEITKLLDAVSDHHWCIPFSVAGNPTPTLQWLFNGEVLAEDNYIQTMIYDFSESEYHGCLQLDNPTHLNNGQYTLVAVNKFGRDQKSIDAHFMRKPWDGVMTEPYYYDSTTEDPPIEPGSKDSVAVYVVVGIAAVAFTGFILMLVLLKFGRNSKFGIKGFVLFHNVPVEVLAGREPTHRPIIV